ncbi:MAG: enoyl-ACP reductase FabI [Rhodospirillales bacterium]|nr:enoyl-ACP reductase FabI [Rhodospirillales bacterium]
MEPINLMGRKALVVGIANEKSLAAAVARHLRAAGADLAFTYRSERTRPHVEPFAKEIGAEFCMACDIADPKQMKKLFKRLKKRWNGIDIIFHAIGAAPKEDLKGKLINCSAAGFTQAMDTSVFSFIRLARMSEPMMSNGGSLLTLTFYGADRVVDHYNVMGPAKAALQTSVQYLAHELGPNGIRVNAISAGPVKTRASSGIVHFDKLIHEVETKAPLRRTIEADEVGRAALFLLSDYASGITGEIMHVDAGHHIAGMIFDDD